MGAIPQEFGITGITLPLVRRDLVAAAGRACLVMVEAAGVKPDISVENTLRLAGFSQAVPKLAFIRARWGQSCCRFCFRS
jgi:hypothetical protein